MAGGSAGARAPFSPTIHRSGLGKDGWVFLIFIYFSLSLQTLKSGPAAQLERDSSVPRRCGHWLASYWHHFQGTSQGLRGPGTGAGAHPSESRQSEGESFNTSETHDFLLYQIFSEHLLCGHLLLDFIFVQDFF